MTTELTVKYEPELTGELVIPPGTGELVITVMPGVGDLVVGDLVGDLVNVGE